MNILDETVIQLRDCPYEQFFPEISRAMVDCHLGRWSCYRNTEEHLDSIFCSELTAAIYMKVGLLPVGTPACAYIPADFSRDTGANCSSFFGCCLVSWLFGRICPWNCIRGRNFRQYHHWLGPEIPLFIPIPPA